MNEKTMGQRGRVSVAAETAGPPRAADLHLMHQPCVDLRTMQVSCAEALIRWEHPSFGDIPPADFIPRAEENGDILAIGTWVIDAAVRQVSAWRRAGRPTRISVNVSPQQIDSGRLTEEVSAALARHAVPADAVQIEVTEGSAVRDVEAAAATMGALKSMGVRLAIDDFGKGYAGIPTFFWLPATTLKIDKSLVDRLAVDEAGAGKLLKALFAFSASMGATTVAEGVETRSQLDQLRLLGCEQVQGFFFSEPVGSQALRHDYSATKQRRAPRLLDTYGRRKPPLPARLGIDQRTRTCT